MTLLVNRPHPLHRRRALRPRYRVCLFGGRDLPRSRAFDVWLALSTVMERRHELGQLVLVNGMCATGADLYAREWAEATGRPVVEFPADWDRYGKAAGPIRNRAMASSGLTGAIEFPGGRGTANMREACEGAGVAVWRWT